MNIFGFKFPVFPVTSRRPSGPRDFGLRGLCASAVRTGFTLVEMLVALAILAVMMAAIGEIFSLAGHATRLGQATLKVMANVRAVQAQLAKDLGNLDTGGYLIIRQENYAPLWNPGGASPGIQYQPGDEVAYGSSYYYCTKANAAAAANQPGTGAAWQQYWTPLNITLAWTSGTSYTAGEEVVYDGANYLCIQANTASAANEPGTAGGAPYWSPLPPVWRADQLTFLANGNFQSRTGNSTGSLVDYVTSSSAAVWYGQLIAQNATTAPTAGSPLVYWPQDAAYPSSPAWLVSGDYPSGENAGDFYLGRRVLLLVPSVPPALGAYAAYSNTTFGTPASGAVAGESPTYITSSRLDIATITPAAIEAAIASAATYPTLASIADAFCYRFASVVTPAASEVAAGTPTQLINGYFRMTPIVLPGVPSFSVDVGYLNATGQLQWYGPDALAITAANNPNPTLYPSWPTAFYVSSDPDGGSSLVFTQADRQYWPTALKITYVVTDPQNRMEGGQVITQIISLPQ